MSSWIIAKSRPTKKKPEVTKYHDTSSYTDVFSMYLDFIGSYIYSQKMGETCNIWEEGGLLKTTLRTNPQIKYLKEKPEDAVVIRRNEYSNMVSELKFKEVQKIAGSLIVYNTELNQTVIRYLEKAGIRASFDIGIQLVRDPAGPDLALFKKYAAIIKAFQVKAKKDNLSVYIMADNYSIVTQFQVYCDPSWKVTSLSKTPPKDIETGFIHALAEVQVMTALQSVILDFDRAVDRFIYLLQRNQKYTYFLEINNKEWKLLDGPV